MFQKANDPVALAVDLVNTWDELEPEPELLRDAAALKRFLARHGYEHRALTVAIWPRPAACETRCGPPSPPGTKKLAVQELNGVLAGSAAKPQFERSGEEWGVRWVGRVSDSVATAAAMSLLEAIRDDGCGPLRHLRGRTVLLRVRRPLEEPVAPLLLRPLRRPGRAGAASRAAPSQAAGRSRQAGAATLGHRRGYSSAGRAPGSHPGGRRFEPG